MAIIHARNPRNNRFYRFDRLLPLLPRHRFWAAGRRPCYGCCGLGLWRLTEPWPSVNNVDCFWMNLANKNEAYDELRAEYGDASPKASGFLSERTYFRQRALVLAAVGDAPAVLRLDLGASAHDPAVLWKQSLNRSTRRLVLRARANGLRVSEETGPAALDTFTALWSSACSRHGAPMRPDTLFKALFEELDAHILIVRAFDGEALASLVWLVDGTLAWLPWAASTLKAGAGELLYWALIESTLNSGADIVDFGRSPVGGGVYQFKRKFGAVPVPVLWLSDKPQDLCLRQGRVRRPGRRPFLPACPSRRCRRSAACSSTAWIRQPRLRPFPRRASRRRSLHCNAQPSRLRDCRHPHRPICARGRTSVGRENQPQ